MKKTETLSTPIKALLLTLEYRGKFRKGVGCCSSSQRGKWEVVAVLSLPLVFHIFPPKTLDPVYVFDSFFGATYA